MDGVCCDLACDGQCEACNVKGSEGACTPVTGDPHTPRAACDALPATDCAKTTCDGASRTSCAGWANVATTSCGADACTPDKKLQQKGHCDGKGGCQKPDPIACGDYVCDTTANACKTSCAADTDCASTFKCDTAAGKCVQGSTCSADKTKSIDKTGASTDCAPYMCGTDGSCLKQCATTEDCVVGSSCDTVVHACVVTNSTATTTSSGGCAASGSSMGGAGQGATMALGLLLGSWWLRRRNRDATMRRS